MAIRINFRPNKMLAVKEKSQKNLAKTNRKYSHLYSMSKHKNYHFLPKNPKDSIQAYVTYKNKLRRFRNLRMLLLYCVILDNKLASRSRRK